MKREDVIRKIEMIASRVDSAFCMHIEEIYLFGSALYKEEPRDIDLLIRYHITEEDDKKYREFFEREVMGLPLSQFRFYERDYKTKLVLKKGMKLVDLHFTSYPLSKLFMKTKSLLLVWSRNIPNIRENLALAGWGSPINKLLGEETTNFRAQLKNEGEKRIVLEKIIRAIRQVAPLSEEQKTDVVITVLYNIPKTTVKEKRIREILQENYFPQTKVVTYRSKGSKVMYLTSAHPLLKRRKEKNSGRPPLKS